MNCSSARTLTKVAHFSDILGPFLVHMKIPNWALFFSEILNVFVFALSLNLFVAFASEWLLESDFWC